ncbi:AB hydrolase superfamily protein [Pleurotus pulmonarius]
MSTSRVHLTIEPFILSTRDRLRSRANRYTARDDAAARRGTHVTLIFAHGLGFHKEHWEPVIQELFTADIRSGCPVLKEAWSVDSPDHGQSVFLNEEELRRQSISSCGTYGTMISTLIHSGLVDRDDKIVFIGHSAGASAGVISTSHYERRRDIPYSSMILIEPVMYSRELLSQDNDVQNWIIKASKACLSRRDSWTTISAAKTYLSSKSPWKLWDPRMLDIYVTLGGLRQLPSPPYGADSGVTLTVARTTQSSAYADVEPHHVASEQLNNIASHIPIQAIFGTRVDYCPRVIQDNIRAVLEKSSNNQIEFIEDAGHTVVQEQPTRLAQALYRFIQRDFSVIQSRL